MSNPKTTLVSESALYADPLAQAFQERIVAAFLAGPPAPDDGEEEWLEWVAGLDAYIAETDLSEGPDVAAIELHSTLVNVDLPLDPGPELSTALGWQFLAANLRKPDVEEHLTAALAHTARWLDPKAECPPTFRFAAADVVLRAAQRLASADREPIAASIRQAADLVLNPATDRGDFVESWDGHLDELRVIASVVLAPDLPAAIAGVATLEAAGHSTNPFSAAERVWAFLCLYGDDIRHAVQRGGEALQWLAAALGLTRGETPVGGDGAPAFSNVEAPPRTLRAFTVTEPEKLDGIDLRITLLESGGMQTIRAEAHWDGDDSAAEPLDRELSLDLFVLSEHAGLKRYRLAGALAFERGRGTTWIARTTMHDQWERDNEPHTAYIEAGDTAFVRVFECRAVH